MSERQPAPATRAAIKARLEALERAHPEGWAIQAEKLCEAWARLEGLPEQPKPGQQRRCEAPDPQDLATENDSTPIVTVHCAPNDEFQEVRDIVRGWPFEWRASLADELGIAGTNDPAAITAAFGRGHEAGKAEGQRELLQRLFERPTTRAKLVERLCVAAVVEVGLDSAVVSRQDLAQLTELSSRTFDRRVAEARTADFGG